MCVCVCVCVYVFFFFWGGGGTLKPHMKSAPRGLAKGRWIGSKVWPRHNFACLKLNIFKHFRPATVDGDLPPCRAIDRTALQAPGQHETLPVDLGLPTVDRDCSIALHCTSRRSNGHCSRRSSMHLVMTSHITMHDDQGPVEKEGRDGGPLKLLT